MRIKWTQGVSLLALAAAVGFLPAGQVLASCPTTGVAVFHGLPNADTISDHFASCGANPATFIWFHGRAIQGVLGGGSANAGNTASGHDSNNKSGFTDGTVADFDLANPNSGAYFASGDFGADTWDGCIENFREDLSATLTSVCNPGVPNFGVLDYALAGIDPAQPNVALMVAFSVDWNEVFQGWLADNAGAPAVDGNACGGDGNSVPPTSSILCQPIPVPHITGSAPVAGGANITFGIDPSSVPILDDCNVAEDKATNCPRNFYVGRVLVYHHGACNNQAPSFNRGTYVFPPAPANGTLNVAANWTTFSVEDANLNGVLDPGEDGTNGGVANGALDPFIVAGVNAAVTTVKVPAVVGASDCIYFGIAIGLDNNHKFIDPPANTIPGQMVLSPLVSVNPNPVRSGSGTPVADLVTTISASKSQGKGTVNWDTGIEMTTAGFNVIGAKKGGNEVKLNGSLIAAKEGTTGKGASYTVTFDAGQLKGSTLVYVEIVKTDGSKERFGPASF